MRSKKKNKRVRKSFKNKEKNHWFFTSFSLFFFCFLLLYFLLYSSITAFVTHDVDYIEYPDVGVGEEVRYLGMKYGNTDNVIVSSEYDVHCSWKDPSVDDGYKVCEVVFDIEDFNSGGVLIDSPEVVLDFLNSDDVKNIEIFYSQDYDVSSDSSVVYDVDSGNGIGAMSESNSHQGSIVRKDDYFVYRRSFKNFYRFSDRSGVSVSSDDVLETDSELNENSSDSEDVEIIENLSLEEPENVSNGEKDDSSNSFLDGFSNINGMVSRLIHPEIIDSSNPFAVMVRFEIPKYAENSFNIEISDDDFVASLDPYISGCGDLSTPDSVYTLGEDISTSGTCFEITGDNIILDCGGHVINYGLSEGFSDGVYVGGTNVTVMNCVFNHSNASNGYGAGVLLDGAVSSRIINNSFYLGGDYLSGVELSSGSLNEVSNNYFYLEGDYLYGLYVDIPSSSADGNFFNVSGDESSVLYVSGMGVGFDFENNNASVYGSGSEGVFGDSAESVSIFNNSFYCSGEGSFNLYFEIGSDVNVSDNFFFSEGTGSNVYFSEFDDSFFEGNIFNSSSTIYSVNSQGSSAGNSFLNNSFNILEGSTYGFYGLDSDNLSFEYNNFSLYNSNAYGLFFNGSDGLDFVNNSFYVLTSDSSCVLLNYSSSNSFASDSFYLNGLRAYGIILGSESNLNSFSLENFVISSADASGIVFDDLNYNNSFSNCTFNIEDSSGIGVSVLDSSNFSFYDCSFIDPEEGGNYDFFVSDSISGAVFNVVNVSFDNFGWSEDTYADLMVYWYLIPSVNYSDGSAVSGVNVSVYDSEGSLVDSGLSSSSFVPKMTLLSYYRTGPSDVISEGLYDVFANYSDLSDSESVNLSGNQIVEFSFEAQSESDSSEVISSGGGGGGGGGSIDFVNESSLGDSSSCVPRWICTRWSSCVDGEKLRECTNKEPSCDINKPDTVRSCGPAQKDVLFDINVELLDDRVPLNSTLSAKISLLNIGIPGRVNASLYYDLSDERGEIVYFDNEVVSVETQNEFIKVIDTSSLPEGVYSLSIDLEYDGQTEPATSKEIFYIGELSGFDYLRFYFYKYEPYVVLIFLAVLVFIVLIYLFTHRRKKSVSLVNTESDIKHAMEDIKAGANSKAMSEDYRKVKDDYKKLDALEKKKVYPMIQKIFRLRG